MTNIFNAIRYPISCPPTKQQLEAIPKYIFDRWIKHSLGLGIDSMGKHYHETITPESLSATLRNLYNTDPKMDEHIETSVKRLRDAILLL